MFVDFDPVFLVFADLLRVALEFLLVRELDDVFLELVQQPLVLGVLFDDLGEVHFDVQQFVRAVVLVPVFDVQSMVLLVDELADLVGFVLDLVDDEVAVDAVQALGLLSHFNHLDVLGGPLDALDVAVAVGDADSYHNVGLAVHSLLDQLGAVVVVGDGARDGLAGVLLGDSDLPVVPA